MLVAIDDKQIALEGIRSNAIFPPGAGGLLTMKMAFVHRAALAGREVYEAGTDAAGDVEPIDDVLVGVGPATVGTGIDSIFWIEVGCGAGAEARDAWRKCDKCKRIASGKGEPFQGSSV